MKKAEAISILATSVRPREAKDRARYDEAVRMAIEALKCSETPKSSERTSESAQNAQDEDLILRKAAIEALAGMIDRFERLLADIRESKVDDSVCGMCEYDGAYMGQSGDWCNECPGFDKDDCFKLSDRCRKRWMGDIVLPSAQPEQKKDEWIPISKETNPTKSGWYLVTVHEDATNDNERFTGMAEFNAINGMWYDIDEPTDMYLRWMPLPAPYRGGEK